MHEMLRLRLAAMFVGPYLVGVRCDEALALSADALDGGEALLDGLLIPPVQGAHLRLHVIRVGVQPIYMHLRMGRQRTSGLSMFAAAARDLNDLHLLVRMNRQSHILKLAWME